ncbi:MAG: sensory box protein [Ramlibacter sp.]|jgi:PAS domain S-box-containing protein|nr:sensory box protein [Ramlibacter sp.]
MSEAGASVPARRAALAAAFALALGLAVTWAVTSALSMSVRAEAQARFDGTVKRLEYDVLRRINQSAYGLRGLAAAYESFGELTTAQFRDWVSARDLEGEFPGVRGFGVISRVERADLDAFASRMRQADPNFEVRTSGSAPDLFVVTDIEPRAANAVAWGLDLGQEIVRRQGLDRAIATGRMALTDRIALLQDEKRRAGWLMLMPVFRKGVDPQSAAGRRSLLVGLLYAPIVAADVLADVRRTFGAQLDFRLYDGPMAEGRLLFDSADDPLQGLSTGMRNGWDGRQLRTMRTIEIGGQSLTLDLAGTPELEASSAATLPLKVAVVGALLSALLALSVWQLASGRRRAEAMADGMTADLRRVAKELSSSEAFLEQAQRIANVGGWEVDLETLAVRLSAQTLRLFDLPADTTPSIDEFIGFFEPRSRELIERATHDAVRDGKTWDLELNLVSAKGVSRWMRTVGQVERQGSRSTRLIGTLQDISDLKQAQEALQASEKLMRVVTDSLPGRVAYWGRDLRCVFANRAFGKTFDKTQAEMIGHTMLEVLGKERLEAYRADIDAALQGTHLAFERDEKVADGTTRTMLVHYIPDSRAGEVQGFFVLALDVTELKEAREAARQASAAKGQFLANTSHELRTPMNAIIGMLTLLSGTALSARQADYVEKADGAARSLLGLLNDILDFSKVEAGKLVLDPRPFRLETLLRDLSVILSANLRSESVEILFDVDAALPDVLVGDDMRLRQVLINLGGIAVKFTEHGEVIIGLRQLAREGGRVRLEFSVKDTGIGIAAEQQARIFDGFTQAEASTVRKYGGTGLGLAISQRLVLLMGSTLRLESEPGRGSRFHFVLDLPLADTGPVEDAAPAVRVQRVLFVDDNSVARATLAAQAQSLGWSADTVPDADEALAKLQAAAEPYDAVFLDWRMPQIDGMRAAELIRRLPGVGHGALIIMVSAQGRARFAALDDTERANLDGYLVKPVTASMLRDAVQEAMGQAAPSAGPAKSAEQQLSGLRLLVVEDNRNNQQVARELLVSRGAVVDIAEDGRQAVDRVTAQGRVYDLVLMDVQMPVMDGYTATREIRRAGFTALPIVAMTANAMASDREACLAAGMDAHVGKPFDLDELVATVLHHVPRAGQGEAAAAPVSEAQVDVDLAAAVRRLGGDMNFYRQLYPEARSDAESMLARLDQLLAQGEREEAGRLFHTIKGLAGTLGAVRLSRVAAQAEHAMAAPATALGGAAAHLEATREAYAAACAHLDNELSRLPVT